MASKKIYNNGRLVCEHYWRAGGHTYEFPRGRGQPRATVTYQETPIGDGHIISEQHDGALHKEALEAQNLL